MQEQIADFGTVTKIDLTCDAVRGEIEIEFGGSEILQLLKMALDGGFAKSPNQEKAVKTTLGLFLGLSSDDLTITGSPELNKKFLKERGKYSV